MPDLFSSAVSDSSSQSDRPSDSRAERPTTERERALSVSQVNAFARRLLEANIPPLWVTGELSGWKRHSSGHCYFTLKDDVAQLRCVMWSSDARRLPTEPEPGMRVRVLGGLTVYERRGDYQMVVRRLEADGGDGLWRLAFERLRERLGAEGLLDASRKRALPRCPLRVGVVTSPVGAVLHDILHVIERRAPWTQVVFCPARVQGDGAAAEIAAAIRLFGRSSAADVLIVGRGGGSVEDLWPFNEEVVARAIAACAQPVISAVGHETDVTIADLVADVRAPTPSAAAELAVLDRAALERELAAYTSRLRGGLVARVREPARRADALRGRLAAVMERGVRERSHRLRESAGRLHALSPLAALGRGYSVALGDGGRVLRGRRDFPRGSRFGLRVSDGTVPCEVAGEPQPLERADE